METLTSAPPKHKQQGELEGGGRFEQMQHPVRGEMDKTVSLRIASNSVWLERGVRGPQWQDYTSRALY